MSTIDLDALQASQGLQIPLCDGLRVRGSSVTATAVQGFDGVRGVELVVRVPVFRGWGSPGVTVTVQKSANGSDWSTAHAFSFTGSGEQSFTLDAPDDYLRVVAAPSGFLREAVAYVLAVPVFVDQAAAAGSVSEITSEDESVTVTNGTGPTVDLSVPTNGGSQTVSVIDCGVVDLGDVIRAGALELVAQAEGRLIKSVRFGTDELAQPSDGGSLWLITQNTSGYAGFGYLNGTDAFDTDGLLGDDSNTGPGVAGGGSGKAQILDTGPLIAGSSGPGNSLTSPGYEFLPPVTWQANHAYCGNAWLIDDDHVWIATNGVSGGSKPDFAGNEGSNVADGTITWYDQGEIPTGSAHVYVEVVDTGNASPPYPASIEFVQQPTDADAEATIAPAVTVRVLDQNDDPYTAKEFTVALFIVGDGTLGGSSTKTTVSGLATFNDLSITEPGEGYVLRAFLYPSIKIASADSAAFDITAP